MSETNVSRRGQETEPEVLPKAGGELRMPVGRCRTHVPPERRRGIRDAAGEFLVGPGDVLSKWTREVRCSASLVGIGDLTEDAGELPDPAQWRKPLGGRSSSYTARDCSAEAETSLAGDGERVQTTAPDKVFDLVSGRVAWISHCPVKGLSLRQLDECQVTRLEWREIDSSSSLTRTTGS